MMDREIIYWVVAGNLVTFYAIDLLISRAVRDIKRHIDDDKIKQLLTEKSRGHIYD